VRIVARPHDNSIDSLADAEQYRLASAHRQGRCRDRDRTVEWVCGARFAANENQACVDARFFLDCGFGRTLA
jgi:hypothetical protein